MASSTDTVTLDNFRDRLPLWRSDSPTQLYAIVDMGSNGIRFTISDLSPPVTRLLKCIYRERAAISLFDALSATRSQCFPLEIISRVATTVARFWRIADAYGVPREHFTILATEAMRRADNAADMLEAINREVCVGVHVLAPEVETLFGAVMGSRSSFGTLGRGGLFLDLGGGSVQMTWVDTNSENYEFKAALAGVSMPFGAARLIHILEGEDADVRAAETGKLRTSMRDTLAKMCKQFPALAEEISRDESQGGGVDVYLCGGGFRGYGFMLMHDDPIQPYPIPSIGTYSVSGELFRKTDAMRTMNEQFSGKILGMSKRRRKQFPAVLEVIGALVDAVPVIRTATFCTGSNREGMLLMKLAPSIRELEPLRTLASASLQPAELPAVEAVLGFIHGAIPERPEIPELPTIFSLGLGHLFYLMIWDRMGEDATSNAAWSLHNSITRDPNVPGLTHIARAVLGLTAAARWGGNLSPLDSELHSRLRALLDRVHGEAYFWAEYIGTVARVVATFVPIRPKSAEAVTNVIRSRATLDTSGKKDKIILKIQVDPAALKGVDRDDVEETLVDIGKQRGKKRDVKVKAEICQLG